MERTMRDSSKKVKVIKFITKILGYCIFYYFFMIGVIGTAISFVM